MRHDQEREPEEPRLVPRSAEDLRSAGDLVRQGGIAGAFMTLIYLVIGTGFWSLVGWGADHLLGTRWIVWLGAGVGACAGIYLVYLHMRPTDDDAPGRQP